jgi:asparagine synthase (glutamine-hydrolysing)
MSAHAGIFHRDGAPAHASELDVCLPFLDRLGPEGGSTHVAGCVSFVHRIYRVTPESFEERQPFVDASGHVSTWDGRIDNREDLALQLRETPPANLSDAAYAHAAFARWGADAFSRLLGEWAIAAWNPQTRELSLARDYSGCGPLFYYVTSQLFLWSSELEAVVAMARGRGLPLTIDEGWIAGFLARGPEPAETPYREIRAVEPGHFVCFGTDTFTNQRHTFLDPHTVIQYRTDAEYEEHFRFLFRQAVACRLRCVGKVFSHLSGGLDSSSVTAMAAHIVRGSGPSVQLETLSSVYSDTPASDESEYIGLMEDWLGLTAHRISESDYPALTSPNLDYEPASPSCIDIFAASQHAIRRLMEESGARVQLSGEGGDELLGNVVGPILKLRDLLQGNTQGSILSETLHWAVAQKRTVWSIGKDVLLSYIPDQLAARLDANPEMQKVGCFLTPDFVRRTEYKRRLHVDTELFGYQCFSQRSRSTALASVIHKTAACTWRRIGPMTFAYPLADRRLVSYLLAVPIDQLANAGSPRWLQRRAMRDLLPPKLLMRRSKRSPDAALYHRINANWDSTSRMSQTLMFAKLGVIDPERLGNALDEVKRGGFPVTPILGALELERWLNKTTFTGDFLACASAARNQLRKEVKTP